MSNHYEASDFARVFSPKNWEEQIESVRVEACACEEDPLGYRAVFVADSQKPTQGFVVGASFLVERSLDICKSGYSAPMTRQAIALIEGKLGRQLSEAV
ncbi:MAG: hypothetical protein KDI46_06905 [Alphaproteobacteria bacterium]|nr:hypothetical protein [Alphaproteobacteria bacterium]